MVKVISYVYSVPPNIQIGIATGTIAAYLFVCILFFAFGGLSGVAYAMIFGIFPALGTGMLILPLIFAVVRKLKRLYLAQVLAIGATISGLMIPLVFISLLWPYGPDLGEVWNDISGFLYLCMVCAVPGLIGALSGWITAFGPRLSVDLSAYDGSEAPDEL